MFLLFPANHLMTSQIYLATPQRVPTPMLGTTGTSKNEWRLPTPTSVDSQNQMLCDYSHLNSQTLMKGSVWIGLCDQCLPPTSVAPWTVRDSLPPRETVSAACLFTGTMPLQVGKEGTFNHPGQDRRTPRTGLPMGVQCPLVTGTGCVHMPQDRLGPGLSPLVLTGFTMFTVR